LPTWRLSRKSMVPPQPPLLFYLWLVRSLLIWPMLSSSSFSWA